MAQANLPPVQEFPELRVRSRSRTGRRPCGRFRRRQLLWPPSRRAVERLRSPFIDGIKHWQVDYRGARSVAAR